MGLDVADRQAVGVEPDDLVVEIREAALLLCDQLRIEGAGAIAGDRQPHLQVPVRTLLRAAVAAIGVAFGALFPKGARRARRSECAPTGAFFSSSNKTVLGKHLLRVAARQ